eukprot:scpid38479/ scgid16158/ Alpha-N-acetylglucosaminidase; N-acetyl-alpha-glucosaminidase; Alpha-N-acetylglucosaminidase 82 kDa form; Alpha-N-acetylglucosaminidase 77 kDa form
MGYRTFAGIACLLVFVALRVDLGSAAGFHRDPHHPRPRAKAAAPVADEVPTVTPMEAAGYGVIQRVLGEEYTGKFQLCQITANAGENDTFELRQSPAGLIELCGTNGVALAKGLYWYLRTYCNATVTWGHHGTGDHLELPSPLPAVPKTVRVSSSVKWRYYMNVCTVSYSSVWWDWQRWEREIDWMALHGINLPLSFTGQEYVIAEYYKSLGMTEEELQAYFSGPAFLAWNRMGNIRGWAGPLTPDNRKAQFMLQLQSLERMRALGMTPVLSGFSGHVPAALERIVPGIELTESHAWGNFNDSYTKVRLLDPTDSHFLSLAKGYYLMQTELMGTDHVYNVDTFNEMNPSSSDPSYLANTSAAVFQGMRAADPDAIWLMQGWLFLSGFWNEKTVKPYLDAVPNSGMIILDLYTEAVPIWSRYESYYGKPFVWCMLHNFGGRRSLCGNLTRIATGPASDRVLAGSSMAGIGLTPEAIEQNPVVYEMMLETGWTTQPIDVPSWISDYVYDRYGNSAGNAKLQSAWALLRDSVYQYNFGQTYLGGLHRSPGIPSVTSTSGLGVYAEPSDPSTMWSAGQQQESTPLLGSGYDMAGVTAAWRLMTAGAQQVGLAAGQISGPLSYDLVDVGRQVLIGVHADLATLSSAAYVSWAKDKVNTTTQLDKLGTALLDLIYDLDQLLITDSNYLLGHWLDTAKDWATNDAERKQFEANARYQITLWGPSGQINDYAEKHWAGLVGTYYRGRWNLWVETLLTAVTTNTPVNTGQYGSALLAWEQAWCQANESYTSQPESSLVVTKSASLLAKWATAPSGAEYQVFKDTVVNGFDIHAGQALVSKDVEQLKMFCEMEPTCVGFISTGYLKTAIDQRSTLAGCDLYVKQK